MDQIFTFIIVIIGLPILGASAIAITALIRGWSLKVRELKIKEQQLQMEEKLRTEELNAKILRMDDFSDSASQVTALAEEVRQLREEVARIKMQIDVRS